MLGLLFSFLSGLLTSDLLTNLLSGLAKMLTGLACIGLLVLATGCAPNTEPLERASNQMVSDVVKPAIDKAVDELSTRTAQLSGQGSLINPGYRVQGHGIFGTGVTYNFEINAVGVSANVAGATQADAGQAASLKPPAATQPGREPGDD